MIRRRRRIEVYHERSFTVARTAQGRMVGIIAVQKSEGSEGGGGGGEAERSKSSRRYHSLCGSRTPPLVIIFFFMNELNCLLSPTFISISSILYLLFNISFSFSLIRRTVFAQEAASFKRDICGSEITISSDN